MIEFNSPVFLWFILPFSIVVGWIMIRTRQSIDWVSANVSNRFISSFTALGSRKKFILYFLILYITGLFLIFASADPEIAKGEKTIMTQGNIFIAIDASGSMWAQDTFSHPKTRKKSFNRFTQAIEVAQDFVDANPNYSYGVLTFSSKVAVLSLPQNDVVLTKTILNSINIHNFESSGSSYKTLFKKLIRIVSKDENKNNQLLFISDGEINTRTKETFSDELDILKNLGVVIHAVGVGSKTGSGIRYFLHYYNNQIEDAQKNKKDDSSGERKVYYKEETVKNLTTKRDDSSLREITEKTGGKYIILEKREYIDKLQGSLRKGSGTITKKNLQEEKKSLSNFFILSAMICFIFYSFIFFKKEKYIYEK